MPSKISACVITYNEEANVRRCLESVRWCDEIIVVDSFSEDQTVEICREYTDKIFQREWKGYIAQRNYIRTLASNEWVLFLDADEEVSFALRRAIERLFAGDVSRFAGVEFPRQVYYLGKWIRHGDWYPDIKLRLFNKSLGRSCGIEPHDQVRVDGRVKRLHAPILHYTHVGISDHLNTMNRFSSISAEAKFAHRTRFLWTDFLFRPLWRFFKGYVLRRGFLDGFRGLVIALISSFGVGMKYAKLWEARWRDEAPEHGVGAPAEGASRDYTRGE